MGLNEESFAHTTPDRLFDYQVPIGSIALFPGRIYDGLDAQGELILKPYLKLGGWCHAAGQLLEIERFRALYAVLGKDYCFGDEPEQLFRLPDLRGLFVRGVQADNRTTPNRQFLDDPDAASGKRIDYRTLSPVRPGDPEPELVGTLQKQEVIEHVHGVDKLVALVGGDKSPSAEGFSTAGTGKRETLPYGGVETRPTNIALYHLIKIERGHWRVAGT